MAVRFSTNNFKRLAMLYPDEMQEAGGITVQVLNLLRKHALKVSCITTAQPVTLYLGAVHYITFGPQERLEEGENSWAVRLFTRDLDNAVLVCKNGALVLESYEGHGGSTREYTEDHERYSKQIGELLSRKEDFEILGKRQGL